MSFLEKRICANKVVMLDKVNLMVNTDIIVYFIPPLISCLDSILYQITNHRSTNIMKKYALIFLPKISYECQAFIEENEMFKKCDIEIFNLPIDFFPIDYDILSLEDNDFNYIQSDKCLPSLVRSISKIEAVFGKIKYKYFKGDNAMEINNLLKKEENIFESDNEILAGIFIDRSVDFVTPMCSVNTYEGLIDEFVGIQLNALKNPKILDKSASKDFSSKNAFYSKIRDGNFNYVRNFLSTKLNSLVQIIKDEKDSKEVDLKKVSENLERYKQAQSDIDPCKNHVDLATFIKDNVDHPIYIEHLRKEQPMINGDLQENIQEYYDSQISQMKNLHSVLKLMVLETFIFGGVRNKFYDSIKRDICLVFF